MALKPKWVVALLPNDTAAYLLSYHASTPNSSMFFKACFALSKLQLTTEPEASKITTISSLTVLRLSLGLPLKWDKGMRRKFVNKFFAVSSVVGTFWNAAKVFRYKQLVLHFLEYQRKGARRSFGGKNDFLLTFVILSVRSWSWLPVISPECCKTVAW